jgi:hypothetical protein
MKQAMNTLCQFSEKERHYFAYHDISKIKKTQTELELYFVCPQNSIIITGIRVFLLFRFG